MKKKKPHWLNKRFSFRKINNTKRKLYGVDTVCRQALCPNMTDCWGRGRASFLILGNICTRGCLFCNITAGRPLPPDPREPGKVADAVFRLELSHAVVTSPTRDDLEDGGASHYAAVIRQLRGKSSVEVLIPDFLGNKKAVKIVAQERPDIIGHNIETVERLYFIRKGASYRRSLDLLRAASDFSNTKTKSSIMLGMGETEKEVIKTMKDIRDAGVSFLAVGQYLMPGKKNYPVRDYIHPERFREYARAAEEIGFEDVESSPYTRSSSATKMKGLVEK